MALRGDYLELTSPGEPARRVPLTKARMQFGRSTASDIPLGGAYVSRRHARIERGPESHWRVIDLGSSNGTFVNGRRVEVATLNNGDVIGFGPHRLVLHAVEDASATSLGGTDAEIVPPEGASVVLDRAALEPDRVVSARLLGRLHESARRMSRLGDILSLLGTLAQEFRTLLRPKRIAMGREDGEQCQWPICTNGRGEPADASDLPHLLVPRVNALQGSLAVKLDDLAASDSTITTQSLSDTLLFPVKAGDRRLGHVYVELAPQLGPPAEEAVQFLSLLTRQAALVWENLELQQARQAADEMTRELSAARQIQLQLFPELRQLDPCLDVAAENIPALGVSGDYYDFQLVEPGRVVFVLADVMGHGLSSALLMAGVQAVFRTGCQAKWGLPQLDKHINDFVAAIGHGETFVSGVLGLCNLHDHTLSLLSAGHPWPSICCGDKAAECVEDARMLLWGISPEREASPCCIQLPEGNWSLVAYTDGLTENPTPQGEPYGTARLTELHRKHHANSAEEICEEILGDVIRASDDSVPQQDDYTLLVFRGLA